MVSQWTVSRSKSGNFGEMKTVPEVLYCDNHILVVVKPAGMLAQGDRTGDTDLLSLAKGWVKREFKKPGNVYLGLVQRLDRPVSGVMVVARTSKAAARLTQAFKQHALQKRYLAVVHGLPDFDTELVDWIVKTDGKVRLADSQHPGAKLARLRWRHLAQQNDLALLEVDLQTGRPHQIRLQLASRGHAILGDLRYGSAMSFDGQNLALHAYGLGFNHPVQSVFMKWQVAPPSTWTGHFDRDIQELIGESALAERFFQF